MCEGSNDEVGGLAKSALNRLKILFVQQAIEKCLLDDNNLGMEQTINILDNVLIANRCIPTRGKEKGWKRGLKCDVGWIFSSLVMIAILIQTPVINCTGWLESIPLLEIWFKSRSGVVWCKIVGWWSGIEGESAFKWCRKVVWFLHILAGSRALALDMRLKYQFTSHVTLVLTYDWDLEVVDEYPKWCRLKRRMDD